MTQKAAADKKTAEAAAAALAAMPKVRVWWYVWGGEGTEARRGVVRSDVNTHYSITSLAPGRSSLPLP